MLFNNKVIAEMTLFKYLLFIFYRVLDTLCYAKHLILTRIFSSLLVTILNVSTC